jgi:hypothetical protein
MTKIILCADNKLFFFFLFLCAIRKRNRNQNSIKTRAKSQEQKIPERAECMEGELDESRNDDHTSNNNRWSSISLFSNVFYQENEPHPEDDATANGAHKPALREGPTPTTHPATLACGGWSQTWACNKPTSTASKNSELRMNCGVQERENQSL